MIIFPTTATLLGFIWWGFSSKEQANDNTREQNDITWKYNPFLRDWVFFNIEAGAWPSVIMALQAKGITHVCGIDLAEIMRIREIIIEEFDTKTTMENDNK